MIGGSIPPNIFCDKFLLLRIIRKIGDIEIVNNTQLNRCIEAKNNGIFDFEIIK